MEPCLQDKVHLLYLVTVTRTGSNPHGVVQRRANSQVASCQVSQLHSDSRHAATKQFTCQLGTKRMKHELANIARWCKMVQDGARWCKMVQDGASIKKGTCFINIKATSVVSSTLDTRHWVSPWSLPALSRVGVAQ